MMKDELGGAIIKVLRVTSEKGFYTWCMIMMKKKTIGTKNVFLIIEKSSLKATKLS